MESFLWIKNIYKAESPMTSPVFTKEEITNYLNSYYTDEEKAIEEEHHYEEQIFDYVIVGLNERDLGVNGYFILVILAVVSSFLSIFLSNKLMKRKSGSSWRKTYVFHHAINFGNFHFNVHKFVCNLHHCWTTCYDCNGSTKQFDC